MFITDPGGHHTMFTADFTLSRIRGLRAGVLLAAVALTGAALPAVAAAGSSAQPRSSAMLSACRPVAVRTVYGGRIARNSHLSPIRNGKVLTLSVNTGAKAMVHFGRGSGRWLTSMQGERFAVADQSISRNGRPGGAYVIAAKLGKDRSVQCAGMSELRANASDTASVPADGTLPASGYTETALSSRNANGLLLENYGPLEICINTPSHPDGAKQTRRAATDLWCYQGRGAYLNDPNGMERYSPEAGGGYINDSKHRHYIAYNGSTVAAAKRPAMNPITGKVIPNTPIVWRIYAPKVLTTNGFGF